MLTHDDYFENDVHATTPKGRMTYELRAELFALATDVLLTPEAVVRYVNWCSMSNDEQRFNYFV